MTALTDALEWFEAWSHQADSFQPVPISRWPELKEMAAAARRVADAPDWLVCEVHNSRAWEAPNEYRPAGECQRAALERHILPLTVEASGQWRWIYTHCRMVRRLLVDPGDAA